MIVVTLLAVLCGYVGWQGKIVSARTEMRQRLLDKGAYFWPPYSTAGHPDKSPSWLRRLLGDINTPGVYRPNDCGIDDEDIKSVFPEADLWDYIPIVG